MNDMTFDVGAIQQMVSRTAASLKQGDTSAAAHVVGSQVQLPREMAQAEAKLNDVLAMLPDVLGELQRTTSAFEARGQGTTQSYAATESSNASLAERMTP